MRMVLLAVMRINKSISCTRIWPVWTVSRPVSIIPYLSRYLHYLLHSELLFIAWVVAAGHRPWYVSNGFPCAPCQTAFEPILNQYGVDLAVFGTCIPFLVPEDSLTNHIFVFVGHTHNSQLILPTANNVTDPAKWNNPTAPAYSTSNRPFCSTPRVLITRLP